MIKILDKNTIDKIAAGEVVEKPASVVKELLENAIDSGAEAVSIDIKNGGIDYIRVSDNGCGIDRNEVRTAFMPHATSKLAVIEDLFTLSSLGFRGEALSSIASVSRTELLTKKNNEAIGCKYVIEGGTEVSFDEAGVPDGTTVIVKDLFYNTPARRKFLKSAATEASYVTTLVEEIALLRPDISVKYSVNGSNRLFTSGNGDLSEVIYRIFGKDISEALIEINAEKEGMSLKGYISKPVIARNSRAMENYFVNSRYVKDDIFSRAIEEGYAGFLMQHRFPFTVLHLTLPPDRVDINVHPRKMEVRFSEGVTVYEFIKKAVKDALSNMELINDFSFEKEEKSAPPPPAPVKAPEPFEVSVKPERPVEKVSYTISEDEEDSVSLLMKEEASPEEIYLTKEESDLTKEEAAPEENYFAKEYKGEQLDLFEEKILSKEAFPDYRIIGQVFDTYWIIEYKNEMLLMDQHAAHEKVNYENFMREFKSRSVTAQNLNPPLIMTLNGEQRAVMERYLDRFLEMGFEIEPFGGSDFAVRTVPYNLYGLNEQEVMVSLLDELKEGIKNEDVSIIHDKIASISCKAAIKGNTAISFEEAEELIKQLLSLDDPYNCPHGRPTIIKMSKYELEKKFKRVL